MLVLCGIKNNRMTDILSENTNKVLFKMSLPISIGMLSTFLFQVIDTYFVGKLGADSLAALSFSSTIYFVLVSLFIGLSIAVSVIIGKAAGAQEMDKVYKTFWVASVVTLLLATTLSFLGIWFLDEIFTVLGAPKNLLAPIKAYTQPILIGMPLLAMGMTASGILRASGNISMPEVIMGIAGVINLVLDYALIFGKWGLPEIGIQGAAYATVLSWVFVFMGMLILLLKDSLIQFKIQATETVSELVKEIYSLGTPTIATQIIGPFIMMFLTFLLAKQSPLAVAAFGVSGRIEMLLLIGVLATSTAITPFIAQNSGAQLYHRIDQAIVFAGKTSTYLGIGVAVVLYLFIPKIAQLFTEDMEVIGYTTSYFYIVSLSYVPYAFYLVTTSILNGLQQTGKSLKITLVKSIVFTMPLALIGSYWGVNGIFVSVMIANMGSGVYSMVMMRKEISKMKSNLANADISSDFRSDFSTIINGIRNRF